MEKQVRFAHFASVHTISDRTEPSACSSPDADVEMTDSAATPSLADWDKNTGRSGCTPQDQASSLRVPNAPPFVTIAPPFAPPTSPPNPFTGMRVPTPPPFSSPPPPPNPFTGMRVPTPPPYEEPQPQPNLLAGMRVPTPPPYEEPPPSPNPFAGMRVPTPPPFAPPPPSLNPFAGLRVPTPPPFSSPPPSVNPFEGMRVPTPPPFALPPPSPNPFAGLRVPTPPPFSSPPPSPNPFAGMRVPTPPPYEEPQPQPNLFAGMRVPTPPPYEDPLPSPNPFAGMRVPTPPPYEEPQPEPNPFAGMRVPTPPPFSSPPPSPNRFAGVTPHGIEAPKASSFIPLTKRQRTRSFSEDDLDRRGYLDAEVPSANDLQAWTHRHMWRKRIESILHNEVDYAEDGGLSKDSMQVVRVEIVGVPQFLFTGSASTASKGRPIPHSQSGLESAIAEASTAYINASKRRRAILERQLKMLDALDLLEARLVPH